MINNAGTINNSLFQMTSLKSIRDILKRTFSQFLLTQIYLKLLNKSKNGSVVFVSQIHQQKIQLEEVLIQHQKQP